MQRRTFQFRIRLGQTEEYDEVHRHVRQSFLRSYRALEFGTTPSFDGGRSYFSISASSISMYYFANLRRVS
jgi:hypothetical protein